MEIFSNSKTKVPLEQKSTTPNIFERCIQEECNVIFDKTSSLSKKDFIKKLVTLKTSQFPEKVASLASNKDVVHLQTLEYILYFYSTSFGRGLFFVISFFF